MTDYAIWQSAQAQLPAATPKQLREALQWSVARAQKVMKYFEDREAEDEEEEA